MLTPSTHTASDPLKMIKQTVQAAILLAGCSTPLAAQEAVRIDFSRILDKNLVYSSGETVRCRNPKFSSETIEQIEDGIKLIYPKGSSTPSEVKRGYPLGGMTAICPLPEVPNDTTSFNISYTIDVPEDFDPGRGMKLFGICAQDCPRGGREKKEGVSLRLHTLNRNGRMLFSSYIYGSENQDPVKGEHNLSHVEFKEGGQYEISISVNYTTGKVEVSIGDQEIYSVTRQDFIIPYNNDLKNWNFIPASFYGGNPNWGPEQDTHVNFTNFNFTFYQ